MIKLGEEMVEFAKFTIKVLNDVVLANKAYVDMILSDIVFAQDLQHGPGRRERQGDISTTARSVLSIPTAPNMPNMSRRTI